MFVPARVSIIIPVYNSERFLGIAIESALAQTWSNIEIIVVNDGSTDTSNSIARSYERENVKVVTVNNGGAARARNIGFQHATGDYIQYLDADDLMVSNKIELQMNRLLSEAKPERVLCAGQWIRFSGSVENIQGGVGPGGDAERDMSPMDWLLLRPYNLMTVHAWLTPRTLIVKAGPWNESMTLDDDGEFFIRVIGAAERIIFCSGALTYYRTIQDSLSHYTDLESSSRNCDKLSSAYKSLETYRQVLNRYGDGKAKYAIAKNFLYMAFDAYLICNDVFEKCIRQSEIPFFQRHLIYKWKKGTLGRVTLITGWKRAKELMIKRQKRVQQL